MSHFPDAQDNTISLRDKGFPAAAWGARVSDFVAAQPHLFTAGFSWPVMTLRASAIEHNIAAMARWCTEHGISHAPHAKTTMAPAIFTRQLAAGTWGLTAATPWHVQVYRAHGVPRVLLANELVDLDFLPWLATEVAKGFEFVCYVDSVGGAASLAAGWAHTGATVPLQVVVEFGLPGGRTGCRTDDEAAAVARAVAATPQLSLRGVAGYEGPLGHDRDDATKAAVGAYVARLGELLGKLDAEALLDTAAPEFLLTCGGSGHVDVVTDALTAPLSCTRPVQPLLRAGSYVTHDDGLYARTSSMAQSLTPAVELWCQVLSRPEPRLALLGVGRRDVSFDSGLPIAKWRRSHQSGALTPLAASISKLNDQHAFVDVEPEAALDVGDLVGLGISHPCTTHDKWQLVPLLDDERRVIDCVRAYF